jgi:hypothetical protein
MQKIAGLITENELNENENLNEWALDMNMVRTSITPNNIERYGDYDPSTNTLEVENGSDQMADFLMMFILLMQVNLKIGMKMN